MTSYRQADETTDTGTDVQSDRALPLALALNLDLDLDFGYGLSVAVWIRYMDHQLRFVRMELSTMCVLCIRFIVPYSTV
ncbi:hypothetical protein AG1IA_09540 [Rhizoctonia solani AG-1 IA]|uniref:Uncharacterized protein n=1 Tax=Thanatephorus cucumeris (strain AG1-IA) TaxID=983506 RepID=L8WEQ0_THACA|nr:hypothetical protein AG1IA_09540 [Rhizoctonia solani AG-1 IA]